METFIAQTLFIHIEQKIKLKNMKMSVKIIINAT